MLTLLTCTGARPEAFAICERLMAAQTYAGPVRWIVVDDGEEATPITFTREGWEVRVVRPLPRWQPGMNTQARNMRAGLAFVDMSAHLLVIEDDDYYAPSWLDRMSYELMFADLVGEPQARYYNIKTRHFRQLQNTLHSSLCSTALKGAAIQALFDACNKNDKFIDIKLWQSDKLKKRLVPSHDVVGIKGLPGRGGIGMGHQDSFGAPDKIGIFEQWLGDGAALYADQL